MTIPDDVKMVWVGEYIALWSDGSMSHDDGVGYVGETPPDIVETLYNKMKDLFEKDTVTISKEEHDKLRDNDLFLSCLEEAGVDNWVGYSHAYDMYDERDI